MFKRRFGSRIVGAVFIAVICLATNDPGSAAEMAAATDQW